jgi:branched-subunit amino acid transport protein
MAEALRVRPELLALLLAAGLGTYLSRWIPLWLTLRRGGREETPGDDGAMPAPLALLGPSVIAALLVTSLLPGPVDPAGARSLLPGLLALLPTWYAAAHFRSLGLAVLVGVASYGLLSLLL